MNALILDIDMIQEVGMREAIFYSAIQMFVRDENNRYMASIKEVEGITGMTKFIQWKAQKRLVALGYIDVALLGVPPGRRIRVLK